MKVLPDKREFSKEVATWEKEHKDERKGTSQYWKATIEVMRGIFTTLWFTGVIDSKMCQRLDNFLGPSKTTTMSFQDYEDLSGRKDVKTKSWITTSVAKVHHVFRMKLGFVDQSDVKATVMGLTQELSAKWHENQLKFLIESTISSVHGNYNLDKGVEVQEFFTEFHNQLLVELAETSKNYRKYNTTSGGQKKRRLIQPEEPRSHKKPKQSARRHRQKLSYGVPSEAGLRCPGRKNLKAHLRKTTKRVRCHFCGKKRIVFKCLACGEVFCMEAPVDLPNPASATGKCFRQDGPFCWLLIHGFLSWGDC